MWKPPEYPGPCFDLHFDRFDGLIFEAKKPFEKRVRHRGLPSTVAGVSFSAFVRLQATEIVAVVVHKSATAQSVPLDGVAA